MEKKKNNQSIFFTEAMSSDQINAIGLLMRKFEKQEISYKELKEQLKKTGFTLINSLTINPSMFKLLRHAEKLIKRIESEELLYNDINSYMFLDNQGQNILFQNNRKVLEEMAKHNDPEAIRILNDIEDFQARRTPGYKQKYYKRTDLVERKILFFKAFGFSDPFGNYPIYFNDIETGELLDTIIDGRITLNENLKNIQEKSDLIIAEDQEGNIKSVPITFDSIQKYYKELKEKNCKDPYNEIIQYFNLVIPDFEGKYLGIK